MFLKMIPRPDGGETAVLHNTDFTATAELAEAEVTALLDFYAKTEPQMILSTPSQLLKVTRWSGGVALWSYSPQGEGVLLFDIRSLQSVY
jgi:hypothetical protein